MLQTAQKRLSNMADLEKEVVRLRASERSLRDGICNKLLLEEQVHQLTQRVNVLQPVQQELYDAKVHAGKHYTAFFCRPNSTATY